MSKNLQTFVTKVSENLSRLTLANCFQLIQTLMLNQDAIIFLPEIEVKTYDDTLLAVHYRSERHQVEVTINLNKIPVLMPLAAYYEQLEKDNNELAPICYQAIVKLLNCYLYAKYLHTQQSIHSLKNIMVTIPSFAAQQSALYESIDFSDLHATGIHTFSEKKFVRCAQIQQGKLAQAYIGGVVMQPEIKLFAIVTAHKVKQVTPQIKLLAHKTALKLVNNISL